MTKDAYYFSHDSNARHDPKIVKMLTKYPNGYQWYFMIIEILREQADYRYKMDEYYSTAIARELHIDRKEVEQFVADCINEFNLFVSDSKKFWSRSLLKRMKFKDKKSKIYSENAKKRWGNENAMAMQLHSNGNALKESKGKESKVKGATLFINSEVSDKESFREAFYKNPDYTKYDYRHYYEAVKNWSGSNNKKKANWILTAYTWARNDKDPKLVEVQEWK